MGCNFRGMVMVVSALLAGCQCEPETDAPKPTEHVEAAPGSQGEDSQTAVDKMVFKGPGEMLSTEIGEWKIKSAPRYFGPDNLFDLINGGAEIFVEFGLKEMVTADFYRPRKSDKTVTVEIYDQGTVLGAFGRMARYLSGHVEPTKVQQGLPASLSGRGMFGGGDIVFWKNRFVVHLTLLDESPTASLESTIEEGKKALPMFAEKVAAKIAGESPIPAEFERFPEEHRIASSETWDPKQVLSFVDLGSGYKVRYHDGEKRWVLFTTSEYSNEEAVASAVALVTSERTSVTGDAKRSISAVRAGNRVVGLVQANEPFFTDTEKEPLLKSLVEGFVVK